MGRCYWENAVTVIIKCCQLHHPFPLPSWAPSFDEYKEQWSEVRLINFSEDGRPCTLMTFFHSILISKWRCFRRFDEVKAIHFPAQRGPSSHLPFVLTLGDNHIGDLSLARLRPCLSPSNTVAGLAWTARESTPFNTPTETERKRERERINPIQGSSWKKRESEGVLANTTADR